MVVDVDNQGESWWLKGAPPGDPRSELWERRRRCYDLVLDSLAAFEEQESKAPLPVDVQSPKQLAFELAISAEDQGFHSALYDWMIGRGMADQLLEQEPRYLEDHLKREPMTLDKYQLLWQYYVKIGMPLRAAEVLGALATSDTWVTFHYYLFMGLWTF
jgi:nuclear pore complex protein Nup155